MVSETPKEDSVNALLPDRYPQHDLFICDVADAVLKDLIPQMEHPFYSLSKKPETRIRRYEHNGNWLQVVPSVKGLATIYDKDILIYAISQIFAKLNVGEKVSKRIKINTHDLLIFTNRGTAGKDYKALVEALERIRGTTITTNIHSQDNIETETFGLIESSLVRREHGLDGRLLSVEITLSDWVFEAIRNRKALTLHRDYFRLRKPIERRTYELARKHCGQQPRWECFVETLHIKSGSQGTLKEFRRKIREITEIDHLPDYHIRLDEETDKVTFINRDITAQRPVPSAPDPDTLPSLPTETYTAAKAAAPGSDIYALEQEWRAWWASSGKPVLQNPSAAFVGFCKARTAHRSAS